MKDKSDLNETALVYRLNIYLYFGGMGWQCCESTKSKFVNLEKGKTLSC